MRISKFLTAGLALFAGSTHGAVTSTQLVSTIDSCTETSGQILTIVNNINIVNAVILLPQAINLFVKIVATISASFVVIDGTEPFTDPGSEGAIVTSLTAFVTVHQQLLNVFIGKAGLIRRIPIFGPRFADVLKQIEFVVDAIAFAIISLVPRRAADCLKQKDAIDRTLKQALTTFA